MRLLLLIAVVLVALLVDVHTRVQAEQIDACGRLDFIDTGDTTCLVFWPFFPASGDTFYWYWIADARRFGSGDAVRISGEIVACPGLCMDWHGELCIVNYTIAACPPDDLGCGVLSGPYDVMCPCSCYVWHSPRHGPVEVAQTTFTAGDTVHVQGHLTTTMGSQCMVGRASLYQASLEACADTVTQTVTRT